MKREATRGKKCGLLRVDESGQVLVLVALGMVFLIGMAALAVDISHGWAVRHELQNAADASALAGAGSLFTPPPGPDWARAEGAASGSIAWNRSDGRSLATCQVQSGYWNLSQSPAGLQSQAVVPGAQDVPAVMVQVSRAAGQNGGPMPTFFARIFGMDSIPVQAQAVAVVSNPGYVAPGPLFPLALSKELAEKYKDYNDPANPFIIGSAYHYPNGMAGQWTSFLEDHNDVTYARGLIENGNPDPVGIGDKIYIQPGTETTLFDGHGNTPSVSDYIGEVIYLPVVDAVLLDGVTQYVEVCGFVGVHVVSVEKAPEKKITGYFIDGATVPTSGGTGPNYGALTPIHLVQ